MSNDVITLYTWDADGVYSGAIDVDPMGPVPARSTLIAPPEVAGGLVALWAGQWIEGIAGAIALHVQACFAAERAHHEAINSSNYPELLSYDVEKFWPSNLMT